MYTVEWGGIRFYMRGRGTFTIIKLVRSKGTGAGRIFKEQLAGKKTLFVRKSSEEFVIWGNGGEEISVREGRETGHSSVTA